MVRVCAAQPAAWLICLLLALVGCSDSVSKPPRFFTQPQTPVEPIAVPVPKPAPPEQLLLEDLSALNPQDVFAALGPASFEREEGDMEIMQFRSQKCILEVVYGPQQLPVHVEARAASGTPIDIQPCLDSIRRQRLQSKESPAG